MAAIAVAAVACQTSGPGRPGPDAEKAQAGDWLVYGDNVEPTTLNCARAAEASALRICRLVADSLIDFDERAHFVPRLAASFDVSPDGLSIVFHLRQGVTWHDGSPFGARDVLYSVDLIRRLDPDQARYRTLFGPMDLTAPDEHTIRAVYAEPFAGALSGWRDTLILPAHLPFDPAGASSLDRAPVGTGPFRFIRWDPQQQIVLEANETYFAGRPLVDRFVQKVVPNAEALRAAAKAGTVDVAGLSSDWLQDASHPSQGLPFRVLTYPLRSMEMVYWNISEPRGLFTDARVRRAMTLLLDREGYVANVHHGVYRTAATLIDPSLWGGDPSLKPLPFDPAEAGRLLDEAGVKDRDGDGIRDTASGALSYTLLFRNGTPGHREIASLLERAAAGAGVKVDLQALEWPILRERIQARQFEAALMAWTLEPLPDPYDYFHSSKIAPGSKNLGGYRSDEFDRLAEQFRRSLEPDRSAAILVELQQILHRDQPCTVVAIRGAVTAVHKRFRIPEPTAAGLWNWYPSLIRWWVPPDERLYG